MTDSTLVFALCVLASSCAIIAGLVGLFFKDTAGKSEQWNRDFGARFGALAPRWLSNVRIPRIFGGLWLIFFGLLFLWLNWPR